MSLQETLLSRRRLLSSVAGIAAGAMVPVENPQITQFPEHIPVEAHAALSRLAAIKDMRGDISGHMVVREVEGVFDGLGIQ